MYIASITLQKNASGNTLICGFIKDKKDLIFHVPVLIFHKKIYVISCLRGIEKNPYVKDCFN